jgi:hypothetical protein
MLHIHNAEFIRETGIDYWLGGVHLLANNLWRWDEEAQTCRLDGSIM